MFQPDTLRALLDSVAQGNLSPDRALDHLKNLAYESVDDFAQIDHHRALRTGFPEVIWSPGKTPAQIVAIMQAMLDRSTVVMATRVEPSVAAVLSAQLPEGVYCDRARIFSIGQTPITIPGTIGVICAGTADLPVAEEAALTAQLSGFKVSRLWDVGVAGLHRILSQRTFLERADILIVVAGMEGALPSVVGGLVDCPVIAVPTSIGYGASFNGLSALLGMLNSCATGLGVVNIDNGFGAAMLAGKMLRSAHKIHHESEILK